MDKPGHPAGSHQAHDRHPQPGRHVHQPRDADPGWTDDSAIAVLLANTATGQTVLDLDDDPTLGAAAATTGRRYRAPATSATPAAATRCRSLTVTEAGADLVTVRWPRPDSRSAIHDSRVVFTAIRGQLADNAHVAVLLAPTRLQAFTVTWTGALLTAAAHAGLAYLQDVVCLHEPPDDHRVVLILRRRVGRHAH